MFVEIENFDTSPVQVDTELKELRKVCEKLNPLSAVKFLKKTNHIANIKSTKQTISKFILLPQQLLPCGFPWYGFPYKSGQ